MFGKYSLDTRQGGSCNANYLHFSPHTAGTHTECVGHITDERVTIDSVAPAQSMQPCLLLSIEPDTLAASGDSYEGGQPDDAVISARVLRAAVEALGPSEMQRAFGTSVVIRTLPNTPAKIEYGVICFTSHPLLLPPDAFVFFIASVVITREYPGLILPPRPCCTYETNSKRNDSFAIYPQLIEGNCFLNCWCVCVYVSVCCLSMHHMSALHGFFRIVKSVMVHCCWRIMPFLVCLKM